jgi:hypothetical protein
MTRYWIAIATGSLCTVSAATDNRLTDQERKDGWILLFDGKTLDGWTTPEGRESKTPVEDGCINPHGCGGYMLVHKNLWSDFVLSLDFKISEGCNSGIFVRTYPLTPREGRDVGWNGIEIAIDDTSVAGYVDTGAIYDLAAPTKNNMRSAGEWNQIEITCDGPHITVVLNGERVNHINLDEFTEPNKRPDGSPHKFDHPFSTHPRKGYIGLQDHGSPCWFKNIKICPLNRNGHSRER